MKPSPSYALSLLVAVSSALFIAGCDSGATVPSDGSLAGSPAVIQLSPEAVQLQVGDQTRLAVTAADQNGFRIPGTDLSLSWTSSDPNIAAVDASGVVTARAAGSATISASIGRAKGSAVVRTAVPTVTSVKLAQRDVRLGALGDTIRLSGEVVWSGRGTMPASWTSLDPLVARVDAQGLVTAVGAGSARIVASAGTHADTGRVVVQQVPASVAIVQAATTVNAIGDTLRLGARVLDANGHAIAGIAFTWSSLSPGIATVDPLGTLVSRTVGLALVTVAAAGHLDTASIHVRQVPAALSITPASLAISVGKSGALRASAADSNGVAIPAANFLWQSSNAPVAAVDGKGEVTGRAPGSATVLVSVGGISASVPVKVDVAPIAAITVSPSSASIMEGATLSLDVRLRDAAGNALDGRAVTWTSTRPTVAAVGSDGVVRGLMAGSTTITASAEGKSATVSVTVVAPAPTVPSVASLSVTPASPAALVGGSVTLVATPRDAAGNAITGSKVSWASQNPAVASVSQAGVVTALAQGTTVISATSEGRIGTATMSVTAPPPPPPAPVASVTLSPSSLSLPVASTASLSVLLRDAEGNTLTGRSVAWSSSNPAVATVSVAGVVTSVAPGSATITATSEGKSGVSAVSVTAPAPPAVATVTLSPTSLALEPGKSRAISAFIKDAAGNLLAGRALAWSSSAPAVATVSSDGTVTAVAAGTATITATSEGKSGAVSVTVSALQGEQPAPEPVPAGVVFQDDFDSGARAGSQAGFKWAGTPVNVTVTDRITRSGRYSLEFFYRGKADCEDSTAEQRFQFGAQMKELWMEYYMYFPKGSEGVGARYEHRSQASCPSGSTPTNNKFLRIWGGDYDAPNKVGAQLIRAKTGDGDSYLDAEGSPNGTGSIRKIGQQDPFITDADRGRWVRIRWHFKLADVGGSNGVIQLWKDGALVIDERSVPIFDPNGRNYWDQGYLMGWANSGFTKDTSIFLDDFRIFGSNPGW